MFPSLVHSGLLDDVFQFGSLVPRVARHREQPDYLLDVEEVVYLSDQREEILARVSSALGQVRKHLYPLTFDP